MRRIVLVEWFDSHGTFGWSPDMGAQPSACRTVGFVLEDTDKYLRMAFGDSDQDNVFCTIAIPKVAITWIHELEAVKGMAVQ